MMRKQEFLVRLKRKLHGLPKRDVDDRIRFYSEMIDDRMEDGLSEKDAVAAIGSVDEIASQIVEDSSAYNPSGNKPKRRLRTWEITLLAVGSPVWLSLAIAIFAVVLSIYVVLWSLVISLWAILASFIGCAVGGVLAGTVIAIGGNGATGIAMIAAGVVCAGLAILLFFGCKAATRGTLLLTKKITLIIKGRFVKKEVE